MLAHKKVIASIEKEIREKLEEAEMIIDLLSMPKHYNSETLMARLLKIDEKVDNLNREKHELIKEKKRFELNLLISEAVAAQIVV